MNDFRDRNPVHGEPTGGRGPAGGNADGSVHQIVFRWDGNHGRQGTGMNAVARSCSAERAEEVARELGPLLWVSGAAAGRQSVVRTLTRDGDVLLVQRWPTTDRAGRPSTVSHVLVGAPGTLRTRKCLGLSYDGWGSRDSAERASGQLDPVAGAELDALAHRRLPGMVDELPTVERALILVTAEWLRDPAQRVSLLTQEEHRPGWPDREATPLVCLGLFLLFGSWLGREWTFATYDTVDTHPLRLMCVPRWEPDTGGAGPLARVMGRPPATPQFEHRAAARLVEYLLTHPQGRPGVPHLVDRLRDGALLDWPQRRALLQKILGADQADHTDHTHRPVTRPAAAAQPPPAPPSPPPPTSAPPPLPDRDPWTSAPESPYPEASEGYPEAPGRRPEVSDPHRPAPDRRPETSEPYPKPAPAPAPVPSTSGSWSPHEHGAGPAAPDAAVPDPALQALHRALRDHRRADLVMRSHLKAQVGSLSDDVLLHELCSGELPPESVELLLDELGTPQRLRVRREDVQHALCAQVLRENLYFPPHGQDVEGISRARMAVRAAEVFTWAVAPLARDERHQLDLRELIHRMGRDRHPTAGTWIQRSIVDPPGGGAPDLPPTVWQQLLRDMISRNDRPPAADQRTDAPAAQPAGAPVDSVSAGPEPVALTERLSELLYSSGCLAGALVLLFAVIVTILVLLV